MHVNTDEGVNCCTQDGVVRDNCFNTTFNLAEHFRGKTIDQDSPLYVASYWKEASTSLVKKVTGLPEQSQSILQF